MESTITDKYIVVYEKGKITVFDRKTDKPKQEEEKTTHEQKT